MSRQADHNPVKPSDGHRLLTLDEAAARAVLMRARRGGPNPKA